MADAKESIHGTSPLVGPVPAGFYAGAEFYDFAPAPCSCCGCCISEAQKIRTYAHVYENRFEANFPIAPFCCCSTEICIVDQVKVFFFDRQPTRSGMCCFCCPCTCCGPPVIFVHKPKCCCMDCSPYCGEVIKAAPCNLYGCKAYICCGNPCYVDCAIPILSGVKNGEVFLSAWKFALDKYKLQHGLPDAQMAIFESVNDNIFDLGKSKGIQNPGAPTQVAVVRE